MDHDFTVEDLEALLFEEEEEEEDDDDDDDDDDDFEFVWGENNLLNGENILPPIHEQTADSCVFHAITFAAEMEWRRILAERIPAGTTDITFNIDALVAQHEIDIRMSLGEDRGRLPWAHRQVTAFKLFKRDGVLARCSAWEGERPCRISSHRVLRGATFADISNHIRQGRPLIGVVQCEESWLQIDADEIYDHLLSDSTTVRGTHCVSFVGFGRRSGRYYLVVANSSGNGFGYNGLGRVYLTSVFNDPMYLVNVNPPQTPSSSAATGPGSTSADTWSGATSAATGSGATSAATGLGATSAATGPGSTSAATWSGSSYVTPSGYSFGSNFCPGASSSGPSSSTGE